MPLDGPQVVPGRCWDAPGGFWRVPEGSWAVPGPSEGISGGCLEGVWGVLGVSRGGPWGPEALWEVLGRLGCPWGVLGSNHFLLLGDEFVLGIRKCLCCLISGDMFRRAGDSYVGLLFDSCWGMLFANQLR